VINCRFIAAVVQPRYLRPSPNYRPRLGRPRPTATEALGSSQTAVMITNSEAAGALLENAAATSGGLLDILALVERLKAVALFTPHEAAVEAVARQQLSVRNAVDVVAKEDGMAIAERHAHAAGMI
jgi:hypothetical protein